MLQRALVGIIRLYQFIFRPLLGPRCRFHPSCSDYAITALSEYSFPMAIMLTAKRIARCHPWHPGGVDPVPPRKID